VPPPGHHCKLADEAPCFAPFIALPALTCLRSLASTLERERATLACLLRQDLAEQPHLKLPAHLLPHLVSPPLDLRIVRHALEPALDTIQAYRNLNHLPQQIRVLGLQGTGMVFRGSTPISRLLRSPYNQGGGSVAYPWQTILLTFLAPRHGGKS